MRVESVEFKYWWETPNNGNMKETVEKGLAEHGITVKIGGQLSIYCYRDYVTKQNTDWFSRNKELPVDKMGSDFSALDFSFLYVKDLMD